MTTTIKKDYSLRPALIGSKTLITEEDKVFIKQIWKHPVPTNYEVFLLLNYLNELDPKRIGFALMLVAAPRPIEICRLKWSEFKFNKETNEFEELFHTTYKPTNRKSKFGRHLYYKEVKKQISSKSKWLNDLLIKYHRICPIYENNHLFPYYTQDSLQKVFQNIRKKMKLQVKNRLPYNKKPLPNEYECFLDKCTKQVSGSPCNKTQYRLSLYGLRRFAITFLYWSKAPIGFDKDIVALSKYIGHSNPKTTYEHYVMPKESIGLTDKLIKCRIKIDQFINLREVHQKQIADYIPREEFKIRTKGQSTLFEF